MKRMSFIQMGRLGIVLGWCVACNGAMRSLGDEQAAGAAGSGTLFTTAFPNGGAGVGGAGVGGAGVGGAGVGGAGAGAAGSIGLTPYVQAPTLPIDPTCVCSSPDQICNAARRCVPRCDSAGRCALWLSPNGIVDLFVDGSSVFFLTAPPYDPLGNPTGDGSLYRVEYPDGTPTQIATGIKDPVAIFGRYKGTTWLGTGAYQGNVIGVTDAGIATRIDSVCYPSEASMRGNSIAYIDTDSRNLFGIDLDGDLAPQLLVDRATIPAAPAEGNTLYMESIQVLDDYIWYALGGATQPTLCYVTRSNLALGSTCNVSWDLAAGYIMVAASGNQLFGINPVLSRSLESFNVAGELQLKLYSGNLSSIVAATYHEGWLYSLIHDPQQLVRYPTNVGRLPQEILPGNVAGPAFFSLHGGNVTGDFAVSSLGVFWFQGMDDLKQPQYIFHAPLPPQPCDSGLPCSETSQSCVNGFCTTP